MNNLEYEKVGEANSRVEAEVIKSFLEAEGIDVQLMEDSVSHAYYTMPFAKVEIFVPKEMLTQARELLENFDDIEPKEDEEDTEDE